MDTILNDSMYLGTIFAIAVCAFVSALGVWANRDDKKHNPAH
jgi:hypothetical protein